MSRGWIKWGSAALVLATLLLSCLITIRHRHPGERSHSHGHKHSHSHGHKHSHSHPHSHSHHSEALVELHDGWHVHVLVLGWEITLWERGVEIVRAPARDAEELLDSPFGTTVTSGLQLLAAGGAGWCLLGLRSVLRRRTPRRVEPTPSAFASTVYERAFFVQGRRDRPPVPPPRTLVS